MPKRQLTYMSVQRIGLKLTLFFMIWASKLAALQMIIFYCYCKMFLREAATQKKERKKGKKSQEFLAQEITQGVQRFSTSSLCSGTLRRKSRQ